MARPGCRTSPTRGRAGDRRAVRRRRGQPLAHDLDPLIHTRRHPGRAVAVESPSRAAPAEREGGDAERRGDALVLVGVRIARAALSTAYGQRVGGEAGAPSASSAAGARPATASRPLTVTAPICGAIRGIANTCHCQVAVDGRSGVPRGRASVTDPLLGSGGSSGSSARAVVATSATRRLATRVRASPPRWRDRAAAAASTTRAWRGSPCPSPSSTRRRSRRSACRGCRTSASRSR